MFSPYLIKLYNLTNLSKDIIKIIQTYLNVNINKENRKKCHDELKHVTSNILFTTDYYDYYRMYVKIYKYKKSYNYWYLVLDR